MQIPVVVHKESAVGQLAKAAAAKLGVSLKKGVVFHIYGSPHVVVETGCFGMPHLFAYERMTQRDPISVVMEEAIKREKKLKERVKTEIDEEALRLVLAEHGFDNPAKSLQALLASALISLKSRVHDAESKLSETPPVINCTIVVDAEHEPVDMRDIVAALVRQVDYVHQGATVRAA